MKSYHHQILYPTTRLNQHLWLNTTFPVTAGILDLNGATPHSERCELLPFHTCGGDFPAYLLLFHRASGGAFCLLPFPEAYMIGDVYSMIVYGLNIREPGVNNFLEYA